MFPLGVWKVDPEIYFNHLQNTFPSVVVYQTSPDITTAFKQVLAILSKANNQEEFTGALKELSPGFFQTNTIARLIEFFLDMNRRERASFMRKKITSPKLPRGI